MRKQDDLIQLLFNIYVGHKWDCMEEYWEVAYALLMFHGARFRYIEDIKEEFAKQLFNCVVDDPNNKWYGFACDDCYQPFRNYMERIYDEDIALNKLNKYDNSEEGWREEINAGPESLAYFGTVCNKFITFKY